jgi:cysteine synthase
VRSCAEHDWWQLRPGQLVVEYTGGSTGSSLAFVGAAKGYPLRIVSSDTFAVEKIRTNGPANGPTTPSNTGRHRAASYAVANGHRTI